MPMVSVIVPLYNKGRVVARAMDSIFAQTFQDFELIVVDDSSTDNGPEIVKGYKDPRLRLIRQPNAGPGPARNRGARESSSPYLTFLDADDEWLPEFLQASLLNLDNNPDCVVSVVNHYRGNDKLLNTMLPPCDIGIVTGAWRLHPKIDPMEMWGSLIYFQAGVVMCRRDVFFELRGFYDRPCTYGQDSYLWLQVLLKYKIYRDTTPLFWYHTEDSEREGPNRRSQLPLLPFLLDPEPIRKNCPADYRQTLERFLHHVALMYLPIMVSRGNMSAARYLLQNFPTMKYLGMKDLRWWIIRQRIKLAWPWLIPYVRTVKKLIVWRLR
jgi:glycosyltransferase involved in cell wall biosynthesis